MTDRSSHEACSEQLAAFREGTLPDEGARVVADHLASCEECRSELRGLEGLAAEPGEALTIAERAALERGVMAGIAEETGEHAVVSFTPAAHRGRRWAGALGAAATVAVIASVAYFGATGGLDSPMMSGADSGEAQRELGGDSADRAGREGNTARADQAADDDVAMEAESGSSGAGAGGGAGAPVPTFSVERRPLTGPDLQKRGESSLQSVRFAAFYSADDADGSRTLLEQLVDDASASAGADVADQVDRCASQVLETSDPTLPSFGTLGTLDGDEVLVLGFAWTRAKTGPLDRYMVWAWERGSCEVAVDFVEGKIETANR